MCRCVLCLCALSPGVCVCVCECVCVCAWQFDSAGEEGSQERKAFEKALVHDLAAATCHRAMFQVVQMAVEYLMCT